MTTAISIRNLKGVGAIARAMLSPSNSAIVGTLPNEFGDLLFFTDKDARSAYESHVDSLRLKGDEPFLVETEDASVVVMLHWGQR